MVSTVRDHYRQAVYQAEDQWSSILDRGGHVDFFGSSLVAPVQMRFGTIEHVRVFVDSVCRLVDVPEVRVRHRRGGMRAHFEVVDGEPIIAIPTDQPWSMRESVVLHEIAHHVCVHTRDNTSHDGHFTGTMLMLVRERLGPEAELLLRTGYQAAGASL